MKFSLRNTSYSSTKKNETSNIGKKAEITRVLPSIPPRPREEILKKSKFFKNKDKNPVEKYNNKDRQSYTQVSFPNVREILKIKENFPNISLKKVKEIHKTLNDPNKPKLRINMTTKGLSKQQIIVLIEASNISKFMFLLGDHIININRALKNIKSEIMADFVYYNH